MERITEMEVGVFCDFLLLERGFHLNLVANFNQNRWSYVCGVSETVIYRICHLSLVAGVICKLLAELIEV